MAAVAVGKEWEISSCTSRPASRKWSRISPQRRPVHESGLVSGDGGPGTPEVADCGLMCTVADELFLPIIPSQGDF